MSGPAPQTVRRPATARSRLLSWLIGAALVVLGLVAAARGGSGWHAVAEKLRAAPAGEMAALISLIALTPLLSGLMFYVLMGAQGRVGVLEMCGLITSAWLLNFLPLSPGLFGRIAYHRTVNGIPVAKSLTAVIWATVLSAGAGCLLLAGSILVQAVLPGRTAAQVVGGGMLVAATALLSWRALRVRGEAPHVWRLLAALGIRLVELHVWAARLWLVFDLVGGPVDWSGAMVLACIATVVSLFPLAPNGVGVREWAVGLAAPLLPVGMVSAGMTTGAGLAADLLHRGVEVLVAVPMGLAASVWVANRLCRARAAPGVIVE